MTERRPEISPAFFALMAAKWWRATTEYPLRYVTMPGFFDPVVRNLALDDRIDLFAAGEGGAHAVLIVDAIGSEQYNRVKVSVLTEYRRQ